MICPFRMAMKHHYFESNGGMYKTRRDDWGCVEENCQWWGKKAKACAVAIIAQNLNIIAGHGAK